MSVSVDRMHHTPVPRLNPIHAVLLAGTVPSFLGAVLSDIAYSVSYAIQWNNFASWLIVGGLVFGGFALLWAIVDLFRAERRGGRSLLYLLLLLLTWILGLAVLILRIAGMPRAPQRHPQRDPRIRLLFRRLGGVRYRQVETDRHCGL